MKNLIVNSLAIAALVASTTSFGQTARTARSSIDNVFANATGGGFVLLQTNLDTNGNVCSSNARYQINQDGAGANGHLATLLTAAASGSEVQLDIRNCSVETGFVSPVINNVILLTN